MKGKILNAKDLLTIREEYNRFKEGFSWTVTICSGAGCVSSKAGQVKEQFMKELEKHNLQDKVLIKVTGCMGLCDAGPLLLIAPENVLYCYLTPEMMPQLVAEHFINGKIVEEFTYIEPQTEKRIPYIKDIPFFQGQEKIVLKNCGELDFNSLEEYIARDGFLALDKALHEMSPEQVIEEVAKSGLRGRGGGGFPTGTKWKLAAKNESDQKYIICNADEGDPGAFMDRSLLEGDPFNIIEGMMIAGYAIGATQGYVYVRAEYPIAIERLQAAIEKARASGLLGQRVLGSNFDFDLEIRIGAGAFVCGEETALIASVEGQRGEPTQKPPYPSDSGLHGKPTVINNVETLGNITTIILKGAEKFREYGTEKSPGTKVFALAGDIHNTGLVEVPLGTTLGEILFQIGGGIPHGKRFKVAQTGGPSGGCITGNNLNVPVDYESLAELGAIMGSGGLICMDEDTCMVDMARYFMDFVQEESCGKCLACRVGTKRMLEILERITQGKGQEGDVELLMELAETIKDTALCGLGQTAPNPVLSTIRSFRDEYDQHIRNDYCQAGVCGDLFISPCENSCPAHINVPGYISLIAHGRPIDAYNLIRQENPLPSVCGRICTHPCESKCRRGQLDEAIAIRDLKRYAADEAFKLEEPLSDPVLPKKDKSVGIIGSGPAGLTCAYYLAKLGYDVTIYEKHEIPGGVLAYGIPEYRLPLDVLAKEIETIKRVGVKIKTNVEIGKDVSFQKLKDIHDSIFISSGTNISLLAGIPGEDLPGVHPGLDFLRQQDDFTHEDMNGVIAVIGGGNTAIDAARVSLRKGAKEVHMFYRRTRKDMPAHPREIDETLEEGIFLHELWEPIEILGTDRVTGIRLQKMKPIGFANDGRNKVGKVPGETMTFLADRVIVAVSQHTELYYTRPYQFDLSDNDTFVVNEDTQMTNVEGVFAGGDVVRGSYVAIYAIADGKKAAQSIDMYLGGTGELYKGDAIEIPMDINETELEEHERFPMDFLPPEVRKDNFQEVAYRYHRLNAMAEAMRCLRCDYRI